MNRRPSAIGASSIARGSPCSAVTTACWDAPRENPTRDPPADADDLGAWVELAESDANCGFDVDGVEVDDFEVDVFEVDVFEVDVFEVDVFEVDGPTNDEGCPVFTFHAAVSSGRGMCLDSTLAFAGGVWVESFC